MDVFGAKMGNKMDLEFPTKEDLVNFGFTDRTKLSSIHWRNNDVLKGIQLKFRDGKETPIFQKDALKAREDAGRAVGKWALKSADIDISKKIAKVSVKVRQDQYFMDGMRLFDQSGAIIVDLKWCDSNDSEWETRDVPED